jgi:hypothetical protein
MESGNLSSSVIARATKLIRKRLDSLQAFKMGIINRYMNTILCVGFILTFIGEENINLKRYETHTM